MSRICVKHLPKYVEEDRIRDFFSLKGEITDAKLMRTKDGKSRQFAFIGFRTNEEAQQAIKYFNKSYLDTCKITCELALKVGDSNAPRPWSKYSKQKEGKVTKDFDAKGRFSVNSGEVVKPMRAAKVEEFNDPKLAEFLEVMQPRSKSKLWANDDLVSVGRTANRDLKPISGTRDKEGDMEFVDHVNEHNDQDHIRTVDVNDASDMEYFKSRIKKNWSDSESESNVNEDVDEVEISITELTATSNNTVSSSKNKSGSTIEIPETEDLSVVPEHRGDENLQTTRLFIRNLPYTAIEEELEEHFSRFGKVSNVHLVVDKDTKRSKGIAYIQYTEPQSAERALEELDKSIFQGRLLHIMPAKQKIDSANQKTDRTFEKGSQSFKQKREEERKDLERSGDTKAWNSLFMRPDTVVENIARRNGISKREFLDRESSDIAVRIALGETQVIAETKKALEIAGVNVASLEDFAAGTTDGAKRSNRIFLVKNLPYGSLEGELTKMFGQFGNLDKVILPPTKTLALVAFVEPSAARSAFQKLAYKRYKDAPLYLEWAPANILNSCSTSKVEGSVVGEHELKRVIVEQTMAGISNNDIDPDRIESRSLFVKNLNFKTSEESLHKHICEQLVEGKILSVRIKKHVKNGKNVSMGFAFIEFDTMETASNVCRDMQGTVLDGHALILQHCHIKTDKQAVTKPDSDKSSTKLLVRNVAFEATEKDLRQLFSPFGQVKSLRLPMKFGNHRGFAFVEYVTKQEAQNALESLSNTHLYGRHLVIERAKEGESLEELRAKTAAKFTDGQTDILYPSNKRKTISLLDGAKMKSQKI